MTTETEHTSLHTHFLNEAMEKKQGQGQVHTIAGQFWEQISPAHGGRTPLFAYRAKIPGGWLFRETATFGGHPPNEPTFIPDPLHLWVVTQPEKKE